MILVSTGDFGWRIVGEGATGQPVNQGYAKLMQLEDDWQASCAYSAKDVMYRSVFIGFLGFLSFLDGCCLIQSECCLCSVGNQLQLQHCFSQELTKENVQKHLSCFQVDASASQMPMGHLAKNLPGFMYSIWYIYLYLT